MGLGAQKKFLWFDCTADKSNSLFHYLFVSLQFYVLPWFVSPLLSFIETLLCGLNQKNAFLGTMFVIPNIIFLRWRPNSHHHCTCSSKGKFMYLPIDMIKTVEYAIMPALFKGRVPVPCRKPRRNLGSRLWALAVEVQYVCHDYFLLFSSWNLYVFIWIKSWCRDNYTPDPSWLT